MATPDAFHELVKESFRFKGEAFKIGAAVLGGKPITGADVLIPLKTMNRHGLIAGATGTGKTKTLQVLTEGLSNSSVPVLLMDIKGDLSGIAMPGEINSHISERLAHVGGEYRPTGFPAELLSISNEDGVRIRATVTEFGPILLSKILGLNDTQQGVVAMIFKYCDDNKLPLLDLKDFIKILQFAGDEGKKEIEKQYGKISTTTTGTILRKVIELQQQGADVFFGEPSFDVEDLLRISDDGRGMVSILRVTDMQNRPKLFSTFMLSLLAELYAKLPEEGDMDKPKLVLFIDEAHLVFQWVRAYPPLESARHGSPALRAARRSERGDARTRRHGALRPGASGRRGSAPARDAAHPAQGQPDRLREPGAADRHPDRGRLLRGGRHPPLRAGRAARAESAMSRIERAWSV
jgi:hypothetical protein